MSTLSKSESELAFRAFLEALKQRNPTLWLGPADVHFREPLIIAIEALLQNHAARARVSPAKIDNAILEKALAVKGVVPHYTNTVAVTADGRKLLEAYLGHLPTAADVLKPAIKLCQDMIDGAKHTLSVPSYVGMFPESKTRLETEVALLEKIVKAIGAMSAQEEGGA